MPRSPNPIKIPSLSDPRGPTQHRADQRIRRWVWGAAALGLLLSVLLPLRTLLRAPPLLDDAYIVFRYALNIRHGLGIAWNPDGLPTYGMAGRLWMFMVLPFTYLPFTPAASLRLASWLAGEAALLVMAITVARTARSAYFKFLPLAWATVALPLLVNPRFVYHLTSGMDTMFSLLANALLILATLDYLRHSGRWRAVATGVIGFIAVMARPENACCALAVPLLAWSGSKAPKHWRDAGVFTATLVLLAGFDLLLCRRYFGSALPMDFGKALAGFEGFMSAENALAYGFGAALLIVPFLGVLAATFRHGDRALTLALLLPAAATALGLLALRQHMGFEGRYYLPFFPFVIVPALLSWDSALRHDARRSLFAAAAGIAAAVILFAVSLPIQHVLDRAYLRARLPQPAAVPTLETAARTPLPTMGSRATAGISELVARLPPQSAVAAAEVGYLGVASPGRTIIDLVGINDSGSGGRGSSLTRLLDRSPDLIWLPPADYTGLRAGLLSDPRFYAAYVVIAGAFDHGIAVRVAGAQRRAVQAELARAWEALYPGLSMQDYVVIGPPARQPAQ